ncbi:unnamed protein product [Lasius platythorax]|uniref:Reverse transcriptase n=1 Tax=Lasius platythorax TaxID=488582 RepID=A0AAV2MXT5_9HYME
MDTGSPVSFIDSDNFSKIFTKDFPLEMVDRKFNALSKTPIDVIGKTKTKINFRDFPEHNFDITLHVVSSTFADFDVIIGRDFLEGHNLTLVFRPSRTDAKSFTQLLLKSDVCYTNITPETIVEDCEIDFGREEKQRLKNVISECMNECTDTVIDDYSVTVHLKGTSPYAYAPRKFALKEKEQIREITDDLLERGIIKRSTSPYCARIVPVRKKNGNLRLCVDLRPLNARVIRQKYLFPLIEDCLTQLSNKIVFTLLDLKDGFQLRFTRVVRNILHLQRPTGNLSIYVFLSVFQNVRCWKRMY